MQAFYTGAILISKQNVEVARRIHEAFTQAFTQRSYAATARVRAAEFFCPDFEMRSTASHPLAGTYRGAGALQAMTDFMEPFEDLRGEAEEIVDADNDRVVVIYRQRARSRGSKVEFNELWGIVYTLRDGKVARLEWFDTPAEALKAVGIEE